MGDSIREFINKYVAEKAVSLPGFDWGMVVSTLEESAANCFRCRNKGCEVCHMTRSIMGEISRQIAKEGN